MASRAFRVFVGNLPWTIGNRELKQFAQQFGPVNNAHVIFDRKVGMSKGYGFVSFASEEGYKIAASSGNSHFLEGSYVNIQPATA